MASGAVGGGGGGGGGVGVVFFFNDTATTEIYTLSLHDALPIYAGVMGVRDYAHSHFVNSVRFPDKDGCGYFTRIWASPGWYNSRWDESSPTYEGG